MSGIDIFIIIIFVAAAFFGFFKGAIHQIGSAAGILGGFIAARAFGDTVGQWLAGDTATTASYTPAMASVLGSIVVFVAVFVGCFIIARLLGSVISLAGLGIIDRIAGAAISVLKWFLAMSMLLNLWYLISPSSGIFTSSTIADGRVFQCVMQLFPALMGIAGYN